ncbi:MULTISPECIES: hypothetical protein [Niallia]|nr:hypothetical protein [Niallia circulans]
MKGGWRKVAFIGMVNAKMDAGSKKNGVHRRDERQNWSEMEEKWCS